MSIANNIDGTSGSSSQLFDLLTVVSNPTLYQEKLQSLEAAIAENKKYVALVGPASDILALKEKAQKDSENAAEVLDSAKQQATELISDAKTQASSIVSTAKSEADNLKADAQQVVIMANAIKAQAESAASQVAQTQANAEAVAKEASNKVIQLNKEIADAQAAKDAANALKADIIAKHKAFIASL